LALLSSDALARVPTPFDFNLSDIKDIWESPRLAPALRNITARLGVNENSENLKGRKIVGGNFAATGQFPFHVLTIIDQAWWCGGSVIAPYFVLTAAHCLYQSFAAQVYSIVDVNQGYYWATTSAQFIIHEHYDDNLIVNDIGLIRLSTPAPNDFYTTTIALPYTQAGNSFAGVTGTIQGFGVYSDALGQVSDLQRYVPQYIMANANCAVWLPFPTELCADTTGGRGSCNGDSGGGLFVGDAYAHSAARIVVGIVSFGAYDGCELGYPVVYTRVTEFLPWIDSHIH